MKPGADVIGEKEDKQDEKGGYGRVDEQGCGGDGGSFGLILAAAYVADMSIFEQSAFSSFVDGGYDQEEGPYAHLRLAEGPDKDHVIDHSEKGDGKTLKNGIES